MNQTSIQNVFNGVGRRETDSLLKQVQGIVNIRWEYTNDGLVVRGLLKDTNEPVTFTHPARARSFLCGYMEGYDARQEWESDDIDID